MPGDLTPSVVFRPRWRLDATGFVARYRGQWASDESWSDRDLLTQIIRRCPNGDQMEIVEVTASFEATR